MSDNWEAFDDDGASHHGALGPNMPAEDDHHTGLDALYGYMPVDHVEVRYSDLDALDGHAAEAASILGDDVLAVRTATTAEESPPDLQFVATNPTQTVTVVALLNGMVHRVDLSARVGSEMTESELADEILAVSEVAAAKGRSNQYELVYELMRVQGQDRDAIRELLESTMHLPTPSDAVTTEAEFNLRRLRDR
ncbi:hypothetical protein M1247_31680 [Mycobacterium sp. 21AC1]|uniref:hypothetical protein n=1 Tax=[Mycobacterium] appelbergii TaxID=2939269 RepID=UPI0029391AC1|nr:hypothetical protein [Mycobacterium sp. 21AC1]MDV3129504.1 hypothetical protein [Mycobacterium sp. 21AC1]